MATPKTKKKMPTRRRNLYLYLTIALFLAIIAIFVFDGYMGVYDNVTVTTAEREEVIEPEFWLQDYNTYYTWAEEGQKIYFHYELENSRLSSYTADVEAAVWFGETKQEVLLSETVAIGSFDSAEWDWTVDTGLLRPADTPEIQDFEFSVIITRDGVERQIIVHVSVYVSAPPVKL